jgi:acyl carrier protein
MQTNDFIKNFADIFDDTDISKFSLLTKFRELDEWSSLHALATLNMIELKFAVKLKPEEMKTANTVNELYELVVSKKK